MFIKKKTVHIKNYHQNEIYAPLSGQIVLLEDVNDEVFRNKMMGDGIAIIPKEGHLYSPISGEIIVLFPTKHVIGIESEEGIKIIIHVGIDSVQFNGSGFDPIIQIGQKVNAGDLLMNFKLQKMAKECDMTTMIVIENSCDYHLIFQQKVVVDVGDKVIEIGRG